MCFFTVTPAGKDSLVLSIPVQEDGNKGTIFPVASLQEHG